MNYKTILFRPLLLSFFLIQISCKKENAQNTAATIIDEPVPVLIDKTYQTDEKQDGNESLEEKSVIKFSEKYNSSSIWQFDLDMKKAGLRSINELKNGNILYLMEEGDEKYNYTPVLLIINKQGGQVGKQKLIDSKSKYNLFNTLVVADNQGGFTLYAKKESKSYGNSEKDNTDEARMKAVLIRFQLDKMKFDNKYSGYKTESKSMSDIFLKPLLEKGFSNISKGDFLLQYIQDKIVVSGTASKPNQDEIPFVAILDHNLNLLNLNFFDGYPETEINAISLTADGNFYVEGKENSAADGSYYSTLKRFVLNSNLKLLSDTSDKEPYYSFYRGPSAPEAEEETEDETTNAAEENTKEETTKQTVEKGNNVIFYTDKIDKTYFSLREKAINSSEVVFEKSRSIDSTALWKIKLVFPGHYEVPFNNSTKGFKRDNGDFVFYLYIRDTSGEQDRSSIAIFVFNKEGRLKRQFQTAGYFETTDFEMKESEGKLITAFVSYDANYVNNEWQYPHTFRSILYSLE
ncbi:hypothetical protein NJT12_00825 [Flavobacterium sp. AC]|uniref:Uncharacterized protein n=1 Tax=Flavobacterium azizsancarii TaxID=2961580 RepID=A0ABT4W6D3_9FLAO|nr:hypothetical protein [Flavobacterium azizsancarii]MDA6068148.1 hypothetical protein [Flavobacterium azizsancarii]